MSAVGAGVQRLLARLECVEEAGPDKWIARCPCHDDNNPSLKITQGDGSAVLFCHPCGSNGADVCAALGLPPPALYDDWNESAAASKRKPQKPKPTMTRVERVLAAAADDGPETLDLTVKRLATAVLDELEKRRGVAS